MMKSINSTRIKIYIGIIILIFLDIMSLLLNFNISVFLRENVIPYFINDLPQFVWNISKYSWVFITYLFVFSYEGLYTKRFSLWDEIKTIIKSIFISTIAIMSMLFIFKKGMEFSRTLMITFAVLNIFILPLIRMNVKKMLYLLGLLKRKTLIIGSGEMAEKIISAIKNENNLGYEIAGIIDDTEKKFISDYKIHKGIDKIESYVKNAHITDIIIAKENLSKEETSRFINKIQHNAQNTLYIPDLASIAVAGTNIKYFFQEQTIAIEIKNNLSNPITYLTKRIIDYILGLIVFSLISLPMIIIGIIIKLTSDGPVIYSQDRIGKNRKNFKCYKFRTMYKDADKKLKEILENDPKLKEEWEKTFKLKNDPRITPIGKFLRKTSLDELPQIFNVLKGEMSLVGPRPVVQKEIDEYYKDDAQYYFKVPPGVTGLWQVSGRSNTSYEYRISLDSWYVKNWNLWLDIVILIKTIRAVLKREGAC